LLNWLNTFLTPKEPLAVSMAGVKMGDRLLMLGCGDPLLLARLAVKTGLTGRACAVDESEERASKAGEAATGEGALVETIAAPLTSLPLDSDTFDLAVVRDVLGTLPPERRVSCLVEIRRVLRAGGRCLVIEPSPRGGFGALLTRGAIDPYYRANGGAPRALEAEGFRAVRTIAERDGLMYTEGVKPGT